MAAVVVALDPTADDEQFLAAYESHCRIVAATMRRTYRLSREDEEDLGQILQMKLLTISPANRRKGSAFVRTALNNCARDELRRLLRNEHRYLPAALEAVSELEAPDANGRVNELLACLTPLQRDIVSQHLGLDGPSTPLRAVAKALGIPATQAQTELNTALGLMREGPDSTK